MFLQDVRSRDQRSGSVMITPALIKDLKENRARVVAKGGQVNVNMTNVPKKRRQFVRDIFTTAVDMKWRYTMLVSCLFLHLHLATRFPPAGLSATHFHADWLQMIGARHPSGLNYYSLLIQRW